MHSLPVRVYYEDTDAGGVVFYANYLKFFERGRTEWLRELGYESQAMIHEIQRVIVVRHVELDYLSSARLDDELTIRTEMIKLGGSSLVFDQGAWRDDQCLCRGTLTVVCVNTDSFKACRWPTELKQTLQLQIKDRT